jgi:tetratricopeptide (TPR) repeat protein
MMYIRIGDVLRAQGKVDEALKIYRDRLRIRERLAASDPSNTLWQIGLGISHERIGELLLKAQGDLAAALKEFEAKREIISRLVASDLSNAEWQRDLSVSYNWVGNVLRAQGKLDEALKTYRDGLAIMERLAASDPSNTRWQRDLSISYEKVGNVLVAQGKLDEALKAYREGLGITERLAAADRSNTQWQNELQYSIDLIGGIAYKFILAHNFAEALEAADQAIALAPDEIWLYTNRAHALMFLDRTDKARVIYVKYRGQQKVSGDKSWEAAILEDFAEFEKAGLTHPLMQEIEKVFARS